MTIYLKKWKACALRLVRNLFYQTNSEQAYTLYKVARNFAGLTEMSLSMTFIRTEQLQNFVSRQAKKVIGIEYVPEAIEDAKVNSEINHITNTLFYAGDMKDILTQEFINEHGRPDVIIPIRRVQVCTMM